MQKEDEERNKISDISKLVKKHLEFVDCNFYREALGSKQRGKGIYILYKGDEVYYIGLSKRSLRGRIRKHATKYGHKGNWNKFSFYQIGKTNYIKDIESLIESLLLRIFRQKGNRVAGRFKRKYNLAKK